MNSPLIVMLLRALHIWSGVFWVGSITLLARFVVPASRSRDGGGLLGDLFRERKLGIALGGAGAVNVITGAILYSQIYLGQSWNLASPGPAEAFGLGGLLAFAAILLGAGYGLSMSLALRRQAPGSESPEVGAARAARVAVLSRVLMALLLSATLLMAIARYV